MPKKQCFVYDGVVVKYNGSQYITFQGGGRFQNMTAAAELAARLTLAGVEYKFEGDIDRAGLSVTWAVGRVAPSAIEAFMDELSRRPSMRGIGS